MYHNHNLWFLANGEFECALRHKFDQHEVCLCNKDFSFYFSFSYIDSIYRLLYWCLFWNSRLVNSFFLPLPETSFDITVPPFRGCMKNVKTPETASVVFDETVGVSKKCSDDWKVSNSIVLKHLVKFIVSGLSVKTWTLFYLDQKLALVIMWW